MVSERVSVLRRVSNGGHRLFLVKPRSMCDANVFANRLLGLDCVEEVLLTSGDVGFIVRTRTRGEEPDGELQRLIKDSTGASCMQAETHYSYRRTRPVMRLRQ